MWFILQKGDKTGKIGKIMKRKEVKGGFIWGYDVINHPKGGV